MQLTQGGCSCNPHAFETSQCVRSVALQTLQGDTRKRTTLGFWNGIAFESSIVCTISKPLVGFADLYTEEWPLFTGLSSTRILPRQRLFKS
eukprot:813348-Amphidinium_carterae.1